MICDLHSITLFDAIFICWSVDKIRGALLDIASHRTVLLSITFTTVLFCQNPPIIDVLYAICMAEQLSWLVIVFYLRGGLFIKMSLAHPPVYSTLSQQVYGTVIVVVGTLKMRVRLI